MIFATMSLLTERGGKRMLKTFGRISTTRASRSRGPRRFQSAGEQQIKIQTMMSMFIWKSDLLPEIRWKLLGKYCSDMEIQNQFWELEDDCILNNGIEIEFIYRSLMILTKNYRRSP